jgi:hypothetical protein
MSTSYTTKLGFGKPASGDSSWGNVVNDQVTTLVEEAIAGIASINSWTTNSHTLTTSNGGSSEARCAILSLTDTGTALSGAGTVIVPDNSKLYSVINATGQTITIKTASGTGVAVPTARQVNVICDGTNVVEQGSYSDAAHAATITSTGLVTANTLKVGSSGAGNMTEVADEDTMSSNSATKLATQQSIKAYADATGSIRRSERLYPWASAGSSLSGATRPSITVTDGNTETIGTFDLYGNARTVYQELDLAITGTLQLSGTYSNPTLSDIAVRVQRKSTGATGTSIGAVTVADVKLGGTNAYWYSIGVAGDQTSKIDAFSFLDDAADGASKKKIQSATYDDSTNRTTIVYNNEASGTGLFSSTGGNVYVSSSGFESTGTWVTATPYSPRSTLGESINETFNISEVLPINSNGAPITTEKMHVLPTLKVVPDSGGAGIIEMRVQLNAGPVSNIGQFVFNVLQVDQTNVTRPV